jgi:hypothetical protein
MNEGRKAKICCINNNCRLLASPPVPPIINKAELTARKQTGARSNDHPNANPASIAKQTGGERAPVHSLHTIRRRPDQSRQRLDCGRFGTAFKYKYISSYQDTLIFYLQRAGFLGNLQPINGDQGYAGKN